MSGDFEMTGGEVERGQRVRITFEGEVLESDTNYVRLRVPKGEKLVRTGLRWGMDLSPRIEILGPVFRAGDVGVCANPRGERFAVVFRPDEDEQGAGWYRQVDAWTTQKMASPFSSRVRLVLRADGTLVEGDS